MRLELAFLVLLGGLVLAVYIFIRHVIRQHNARNKAHGLPTRIVRWHFGHHWTGSPMTDAGWKRPGTRALGATGHARRFWYRPQKHRMAIRVAETEGPLLLAWLFVFYPLETVIMLVIGTSAAIIWQGFRLYRAWQRRIFRRSWLHPLHRTLSPMLNIPLANRPESYLTIPADRSTATVALPVGYRGIKQREAIEAAVADALALEAPEVEWDLSGGKPTVTFRKSLTPAKVYLSQLLEAIRAAGMDEIVLGLGKQHNPVTVNLHSDSPHLALSMGSGGGKSTGARAIAAQVLYKGGNVLFLDIKRISGTWISKSRLPNAAYAKTPAQIHKALIWAGAELTRRNDVADAAADVEGKIHADVGPRLLIVIEEANLLIPKLREYWAEHGGGGKSPALQALADISAAGRQVRMNLLIIAQRLSAGTAGGADSRENIGTRILGRYSQQTWQMLAGEFKMPDPDDTPGRVQVVTSKVQECQLAFLSGAEAIRLATSGVVVGCPSGMPGVVWVSNDPGVTSGHPELSSAETDGLTPETGTPPSPPAIDGVSLKEACDLGVLPVKQATAKVWRRRYEDFPAPVGYDGATQLFDPEQLDQFAKARR